MESRVREACAPEAFNFSGLPIDFIMDTTTSHYPLIELTDPKMFLRLLSLLPKVKSRVVFRHHEVGKDFCVADAPVRQYLIYSAFVEGNAHVVLTCCLAETDVADLDEELGRDYVLLNGQTRMAVAR